MSKCIPGLCGTKKTTNDVRLATQPCSRGRVNKPVIHHKPVKPVTLAKPKPSKHDQPPVVDESLQVQSIDLCKSDNEPSHHTDEYEQPDNLVIRRAQVFTISVTFSRPYEEDKHHLKVILATGSHPSVNDGTKLTIPFVTEFEKKIWGVKVGHKEGNTVKLMFRAPSNALIGEWNLSLITVSTTEDGEKKHTYKHTHSIYTLFNAWSHDDSVYMDTEEERGEYVLNDTGIVYCGTADCISGRAWNFGQFESPVLEASLHLLEKSRMSVQARRSPVFISRVLSQMVNSCDDGGVLVGNWSGDYAGGTPPTAWNGSVKILEEYLEHDKPVSYGQCWVFSGLATTVMRALGIPARSVTNFSSAHDTDINMTIDVHWNLKERKAIDDRNVDSIWNFHVWNEAWMARPDLMSGYGGWQAFDATPQEASDGVYRAGPASVQAIKRGHVYLCHDARFIFAEVNADRVHWACVEGGEGGEDWGHDDDYIYHIEKSAVGKNISTKAVGSNQREDVTHCYKFPEGSEEERMAMYQALEHSSQPHPYTNNDIEDIDCTLIAPPNIHVGDSFTVVLSLTNRSSNVRNINVYVSGKLLFYTGVPVDHFRKESHDIKIDPSSTYDLPIEVKESDYVDLLVDQPSMNVYVMGSVVETKQSIVKSIDFRLVEPNLQIIVGKEELKLHQMFTVHLKLKNPLNKLLKKCRFSLEGPGIEKTKVINYKNIQPHQEVSVSCQLVPKKRGLRTLIGNFNSTQLQGIAGSLALKIV